MMVKANIGNYLSATEYGDIKVTGVGQKAITFNRKLAAWGEVHNIEVALPITVFKPIPLTEHWFLALGFDKEPKMFSKGEIDLVFSEFTKHCYTLYFRSSNTPIRIRAVQYVHELQNLVFALTGIELTRKDDGSKN